MSRFRMSIGSFGAACLLGAIMAVAGTAVAGPITATYEAAGVQTPNTANICSGSANCSVGYETFSYVSTGTVSSYTSNFSSGTGTASAYTGSYTQFTANAADQYGGAGGSGNYATVYGNSSTKSYSVTVTNNNTGGGINYFGLWISALDVNNQIQFYDASNTLIYTFSAQQLVSDLGSCSGGHSSNAYCGNPANSYSDSGELFAYVNFFDTIGTFTKIVFTEANGSSAGFESDNQAVSYSSQPVVSGTLLVPAPEPSSVTLIGVGLIGLFVVRRRLARAA